MKLFNTSDIALVKHCQEQFNFTLSSVALERRSTKFMHKLCNSNMAVFFVYFFLLVFVPLLFLLYVTTICGE